MATKKTMLVNSKIRKYISLSELEQEEKGQVYVLNSSTGDLHGQILMSVPKKNGNGSDLVRVPKTFIPIDLTAQVTRSQLMESSEFRKTVTNGLLKPVTREYAEVLLSTEEGREERRRIDNEIQKARTIMQNAGVADSEAEEEDEYVEVATIGKEAKQASQKAASKGTSVSVKLQTLVNSAAEDELTQTEIVGKLLNYNSGKLTMPELAYLKKKYDNKPRIMKHLKAKYAELKAEA